MKTAFKISKNYQEILEPYPVCIIFQVNKIFKDASGLFKMMLWE
jgi:hypothetical protein